MSIPKDGYYIAAVQCDTGDEVMMHVRVLGGVPHTRDGDRLLESACSQFTEVTTCQFCYVWPNDAAAELEALRTANAGLVDRVRRLEAWGDRLEELLGDPPSANCSCHISPPCNDCVEWAAIREAKAEWSNAKGQP